MRKTEKPELSHREDFYFCDKNGGEIPHQFESLTRNFLREIWQSDLEELDKKRVNYALKLAVKSHAGQFRRERNLPYSVHPIEAAFRAFRSGASAAAAIELLLHDTLEDTWIRFKNRTFVCELFGGTMTELTVRLLSRFRLVQNLKTGEPESAKISDEEYAGNLRSSYRAVARKHFDTLSNLCSDGRRLDECLEVAPDEAREIIADIKRFVAQVREFWLPIQFDFYREQKEETEEIILKIETRIQIVETFLAQNEARNF